MYFTKVNGICYSPEGQGGDENGIPQIEVTQEMIKAAYAALKDWDATATEFPSREAVRDAFLAMYRLAMKHRN